MSTPIKPPSDPSPGGGAEALDGADGSVERAEGKFGDMVDQAKGDAAVASADPPSALRGLENDLIAGRASADEAVERLVQRALTSASDLSEHRRAVLESQLREALDGDPTLAALRKDLQRAASKG